MDYETVITEQLRCNLLRLLAEAPGYTANDSVLGDLAEEFGFRPSRDAIRTQLAWLAEQGLVTVNTVKSCHVATLTGRGEDVAQGRATVPGVKRPHPGGI
jgi:Fe2+ or Zn2+ uptake regulation protein